MSREETLMEMQVCYVSTRFIDLGQQQKTFRSEHL